MWTLRTLHWLGFATFASSKRNSSAWHNRVCDKVRCFIKKVKGMDGVVNDISYSHHRFNGINYCKRSVFRKSYKNNLFFHTLVQYFGIDFVYSINPSFRKGWIGKSMFNLQRKTAVNNKKLKSMSYASILFIHLHPLTLTTKKQINKL